jgi:hypothetical protein
LLAFFFNTLYIRLGFDEATALNGTQLQRDGAPACHERRAGEHSMPYMASLCSCEHADTISGQKRFFVENGRSTSTTCGGKSGHLSAFQAASLETQPACKPANADERTIPPGITQSDPVTLIFLQKLPFSPSRPLRLCGAVIRP